MWRVSCVLALLVAAVSCTKADPAQIDLALMVRSDDSYGKLDHIVLMVRDRAINKELDKKTGEPKCDADTGYCWASQRIEMSTLNRDLRVTPLVVGLMETPVLKGKTFLAYAKGYSAADDGSLVVSGSITLMYDASKAQTKRIVMSADFVANDKDHDGIRSCSAGYAPPSDPQEQGVLGDLCDCDDGDPNNNPFNEQVCGDTIDNNCNGWPYDNGCPDFGCQAQPCTSIVDPAMWGKAGVGICTLGSRTCGPNGLSQECTYKPGESGLPEPRENCGPDNQGNGLDDDCNGVVDDGCSCDPTTPGRECYLGHIGSDIGDVVGLCKTGWQRCVVADPNNPTKGLWANTCEGQTAPQRPPRSVAEQKTDPRNWTGIGFYELHGLQNVEQCDGYDNDCDGYVDEESYFDVDGDGYTYCGTMDGPAPEPNPPPPDLLPCSLCYHTEPNNPDAHRAKGPDTPATYTRCTLPTPDPVPMACTFTNAFQPSGCTPPRLTAGLIDCKDDDKTVNPGQTEVCTDTTTNACRCVIDQHVTDNQLACGCSDGDLGALICSSDRQCVADDAGKPNAACKRTNGYGCTAGTDCVSGYCVDGVCCDGACSGTCERCDKPGALGLCTARDKGDDTECTTCFACEGTDRANCAPQTIAHGKNCDTQQTYCCGGNCVNPGAGMNTPCGIGACAGSWQCSKTNSAACSTSLVTTSCGTCSSAEVMVNGTCSANGTCAGMQQDCFACHTCVDASTSASCDAPYSGQDVSGPASPPNQYQCTGSYTCDSGLCVKAVGQPCGSNGDCANHQCVDGVCCGTATTCGACKTCNGSNPGICTAIDRAPGPGCTGGFCCNGTCVASGTGAAYGASCGTGDCSGGTWGCSGSNTAQCSTIGHACGSCTGAGGDTAVNGTCTADGNGCSVTNTTYCDACKTCVDHGPNADCSATYHDNTLDPNLPNTCVSPNVCIGGVCKAGKIGLGESCGTNGTVCESGNCVSGVCCAVSSCPTCYTCAGSTPPGTSCTPITQGQPDLGRCDDSGGCTCDNTVQSCKCACNVALSPVCKRAVDEVCSGNGGGCVHGNGSCVGNKCQ